MSFSDKLTAAEVIPPLFFELQYSFLSVLPGHRSGEQNLHRNSAPPSASGGLFSGAICSPSPAKPCGFVPGSKIFTEISRRCVPPVTHVGAAPPAKPYITVGPPPTGRPKFCPAADYVGVVPPANVYATAGPRQQGAPNSACRPTMLAPPRRQSHISPSGHANRAPQIPPGGRPCWRHPSGKAIYHRRVTPTGRPKSRPAADHVGAAPPARPYIAVGPRQQGAQAMMKKKKTADTYPS